MSDLPLSAQRAAAEEALKGLSDKDKAAPLLKDFDSPFVYEG